MGITPNICRLCVCVTINKRSFEPFVSLDLTNALGFLASGVCRHSLSLLNHVECKPVFWEKERGGAALAAAVS